MWHDQELTMSSSENVLVLGWTEAVRKSQLWEIRAPFGLPNPNAILELLSVRLREF